MTMCSTNLHFTYLLTCLLESCTAWDVDDRHPVDSMGLPTGIETNVAGLPRGCNRNAKMKIRVHVPALNARPTLKSP